MENLGITTNQEELDEMIKEVDEDGRGTNNIIDFREIDTENFTRVTVRTLITNAINNSLYSAISINIHLKRFNYETLSPIKSNCKI